MAVLTVGLSGQNFTTIADAVNASASGDTIEVTADHVYNNDFFFIGHSLTLQAVGGEVQIAANGSGLNGKAAIIAGTSTGSPNITIQGFDISGVAVNDGNGGNNYQVSYANNTASVINQALLTVSAVNAAKTYDATPYRGGNGVVYAGFVNGESPSVLGSSLTYGGTAQGARNAGNYTISPSGQTSGNYSISYVDGNLSIAKAPLTVSTSPVTKTFDGTTSAVGTAIAIVGTLYGNDSLSGGSFAFTSPSIGTNKTVIVSGVNVNDGNSGNNYQLAYVNNNSSITSPE
jgi:hypothetical protein